MAFERRMVLKMSLQDHC